MNKNFWNDLKKPFFILAPMEAVTDVVFRHVIAKASRPDVFFTEFVNVSSFCNPKGIASTKGRLAFTDDEKPIVAQIWGTKPIEFKNISYQLAKRGFSGIDINMGCPDKAVVKIGAGSALIKTPDLAGEIISATKSGGLPVSVKTRLGYSKTEEWHDWLEFLLKQDITNLTIHLRTRKEMSKVKAHYELIPEIKKMRDKIAPQTLLTINGDILNRQHGEELAKQYGIDGIMIGRGIFQNPFAFAPDNIQKTGRKKELIDLLKLHLDLHDKYSKELELRKYDPLKKSFKMYIRDFSGANELRDKLMHTNSTNEARKIIETISD